MKKFFLSMFLVLGILTAFSVSAGAMSRNDAVNWVKSQADNGVKYQDSGFGGQCTDFVSAYMNYIVYGDAHYWLNSGHKGFRTYDAKDYFYKTYPDRWQVIPNTPDFVPEPGDILCFNANSSNSFGHVAVAIEGCTASYMNAVDQDGTANNYKGTPARYNYNLPYYSGYGNFQGVIRPHWDENVKPDQPQNCKAGSWDDRVQIQWDRVGNADYYECGLIDVNTRNIVLKEDVNDWYYNFYNVPEGQYFAYVCAHNSAGTSLHSGWQRVDVSYTVPNAPKIKVNVEKTVERNNVQVSWEAVNGANRYEYYLSEFPVGYAYTTNTKKGTTSDTSVTFSDLKNGHYEMFIHAISGLGKVSPQSNWIIFDVYAKDYVPVKTISFNGNIYALYDYEMSWSFAKDLCEDFGGHLVTITSKEENKAITDLLEYGSKNSYWLGASDYGRNEKDYAWITGEKFSYNNWMDNEPNNAGTDGEKEHFAEVRKSYGNKWNDVNNINKENKGFILEIETKNIKATSTKTFNGSTYMIFDNNATWTEAKYICEMYGGNLAIVDSDEEKEFIKDFIDAGKRNWYYIGAKKQNNSWSWVDGTEVKHIDWREDALKWDGNFLMMYRSSKNCVGFNNAYFPEEDIKHIGFICEINSQIPNCNTTISLSDKYYLSAEIHDLQKNAVYAAGLYDSSDRLLEIKSINVGSEDNTCELSLSKNSEAAYVKTFLWNDLSGMNPLTESEIIKL